MTNVQMLILIATVVCTAVVVYAAVRQLVHSVVRDVWRAIEEAAHAAARTALPRKVLPMSSLGAALPSGARHTITVRPKELFEPARLFISGRGEGAKDWLVNDIRVDGKTQFSQSGDIPGDMFATNAIDSFVKFQIVNKEMEVDVTYVGADPKGLPFYGSIVGAIMGPMPAGGEISTATGGN